MATTAPLGPTASDPAVSDTAADVRAHVRARVAALLGVAEPDLDEERLLVEYGLNSVDLIDLVAGLEARYAIRFDPETLQAITCRSLADSAAAALAAG